MTNSTARDPTSPTVADCDDHDEFNASGGTIEEGSTSSKYGDSPPTDSYMLASPPPSTLRKRRRVRGEGRFVCATCGKHLSSKHALALHDRTVHQGARDHPCKLCPHQAKQSSNLQRHTWAHHCPDKLMEKYKEGLKEEEAKTITAARLWREAVEPVLDKLKAQLSAKNQHDLMAQKNHFGLLATTAELLGLEETNGDGGAGNGTQEFPDMPMTPLPPEELVAVEPAASPIPQPSTKRKKSTKAEAKQNGAANGDVAKPGDVGMKIGAAIGMEAAIRPCLTCHANHDMEHFHPIVKLMNVAKDDKNKFAKGRIYRCDRCRRQEFTCHEPLLLSLHQATVHGLRPVSACPVCPKVFEFATDLAVHTWKAHGASCPFCPSNFHSTSTGENSLQPHRTDLNKTFVCPLCNVPFLASDRLGISVHVYENHTPERLWKACCSICPAKFLRKEDWSEHLTSAHHDSLPDALKIQK